MLPCLLARPSRSKRRVRNPAVGIGLTKLGTEEMKKVNKGIAVESITYVGDDLYGRFRSWGRSWGVPTSFTFTAPQWHDTASESCICTVQSRRSLDHIPSTKNQTELKRKTSV